MNWFAPIAILLVAFGAVFLQTYCQAPRHFLGAQIDILPGLMVYTGLNTPLPVIGMTAVVSGLLLDSLSANPLGASILPLFAAGIAVNHWKDLILRDQLWSQLLLGTAASGLVPAAGLLLLLLLGAGPLVDWWMPWRGLVMAIGGGLATPVLFRLFDAINRALNYQRQTETSFRADREIKRGEYPRENS